MRLLTVLFLLLSPFAFSQELYRQIEVPVGESTLDVTSITNESVCFVDDVSGFTLVSDAPGFGDRDMTYTINIPMQGNYGFTVLPCPGANFSYGIVDLVASGETPPPSPEPEPEPEPNPNPEPPAPVVASEDRRVHFFCHSLICDILAKNVPEWMSDLSLAGDRLFSANGQYGLTPRIPATDDLGWGNTPAAWTNDFSVVTDAVFTVLNFALLDPPTAPLGEGLSPAQATIDAITWAKQQNPNIRVWIYESWPDLGSYVPEAETTETGLLAYHNFTLGTNATWYDDLMSEILAVHPDTVFIPVARTMAALHLSPLLSLTYEELYLDTSPHGTDTTYFLAALITYMSMYDDFIERIPSETINQAVRDNYPEIVYFIKDRLQ